MILFRTIDAFFKKPMNFPRKPMNFSKKPMNFPKKRLPFPAAPRQGFPSAIASVRSMTSRHIRLLW